VDKCKPWSGNKLLKPKHVEPLSIFSFKFTLRRYMKVLEFGHTHDSDYMLAVVGRRRLNLCTPR
jgi:hypothetical protein